ncbi:ABC transporter substrate-binding protein [Paenibacillaceae bacterium]|nr:ABC transporter substrate-binding protein [Paenibacillaceae bacterium]
MMMVNSRLLTVGRIDYANVWPIFFQLPDQGLPAEEIRIVSGVPSVLNHALRSGQIDAAGISSFAYAQNSQDYFLLPDLSVSAKGRVNSIMLFMKRPLKEVLEGTIALTDTSATSINLLKIIMQGYYGANPHYITMEPSLDTMLEKADAALLIGDPAIKASWEKSGYEMIDLGQLWREWTGYGMTFAVFAVRRELAAAYSGQIAKLHRLLLASKEQSLNNLQPLIEKACAEIGGEPAYWQNYFTELHYAFGEQEQAGLALYFQYAKQMGLLDHEVEMQFWVDQSLTRVNE